MSKKFLHYWYDGRPVLHYWSAAEKYAQQLLICIKFPDPRARGWGSEDYRVSHISVSVSHHISRIQSKAQPVNKWRRPAHFPHHMAVIFLLLASRQSKPIIAHSSDLSFQCWHQLIEIFSCVGQSVNYPNMFTLSLLLSSSQPKRRNVQNQHQLEKWPIARIRSENIA